MKNYPFKEVEVRRGGFAGDSGETMKVVVPTPEAIMNFEHYLDEHEWVYYHQLSDDVKIGIAMTPNPFNAFLDIYKTSH